MKIYPPPYRLTASSSNINSNTSSNTNDNNDDMIISRRESFNAGDVILRLRLYADEKIRCRSFTAILMKKYDDRIKCKSLYQLRKRSLQSAKDDSSLTVMYCYYKNTSRILKKWKGLKLNTRLRSELALLELGLILHSKLILSKYFKKLLKKWEKNREMRMKTMRIVIFRRMVNIRNGFFIHGMKRLQRFLMKASTKRSTIMTGQRYHNRIKIKKSITKWRRWSSTSLYMKRLIQVVHSKQLHSYRNTYKHIHYDTIILARKFIKLLHQRTDVNRILCSKGILVTEHINSNITMKYFGMALNLIIIIIIMILMLILTLLILRLVVSS